MTDEQKQAFEEWFKTANIGKAEKPIARAAWEAGRGLATEHHGRIHVRHGHVAPPVQLSDQRKSTLLSYVGAAVREIAERTGGNNGH